ncbi:heat shock transcription factor [Plasmopara halstedii]|uniref:Heat shock transcription factor n=1 Tax=Plasmopara halstedii TaxID=4781 RepID=A0A0P1AXL8_PLAHL|nr:heat shock transcription factor [Plasmopara halstedii]CEG46569.1 heat shock transcription factor [Plasmopara halstedii]|eukprot:XP_024582938.1 heat shock transcription factor [Plasmopara halstedii]
MPSAKTARPTTDTTSSRSAKRARVSHDIDHIAKIDNLAATDVSGLPAALAASAAANKVPKFLRSLYAILQTEDPRIISWVQNKELKPNSVTAFHILEMERFEREILPKYFKHQKFASFQRQLNNFGFRKWTKTQSSGVCTFSHNCFPPDLSATRTSTISIREQWRKKSTQVIPPTSDIPIKRRFVNQSSNKIGSSAPRKRPGNVQVSTQCIPEVSSLFTEMYRSPNSSSYVESNAFRHGLSHQPPLKKLARPNIALKQDVSEPYNGLDAFCDDSLKHFILPPLQPHHLVTSTPRTGGPPVSLAPSFLRNNDRNGFQYSLPQVNTCNGVTTAYSNDSSYLNGLKAFDMKNMDLQNNTYMPIAGNDSSNTTADAAALQGAFLEPWIWDAQVSSTNFEVGSFPLEFDCKNELDCKTDLVWQDAASSVSLQGVNAVNCGTPIKEPCHHQDRILPSNSEDFGLDNLLFVE